MKKSKKVVWFSAGVSSFLAAYYAKDVDEIIYIDIEDQHPDTYRFIQDCEKLLNKKIVVLKSEYGNVENVVRTISVVKTPHYAPCTDYLKKRVRKKWEYENKDYEITYVWGFDSNETHRADRLLVEMNDFKHEFPLIEKGLAKQDVHAIALELGLKRPLLYDMGYPNNNCIGCLKGGMGYWNRIRKDFPDVFEKRSKMERDLGHHILKECFLDELDPKRGNFKTEIFPECSIMCHLAKEY